MPTTAISYGTEIWLAELKRDGWNLTVSESLRPDTSIRLVGDHGELVSTLLVPAFKVGVLATDDTGAGVFVPCSDAAAAWRLLERVEDEVAGVV